MGISHSRSHPRGLSSKKLFEVHGIDAWLDPVDERSIARADLVAISVPMHTALRLGVEIARRARRVNPSAHICLYGVYASLNARELLGRVADSLIGGEFEAALVELASKLAHGDEISARGSTDVLRRLPFVRPRRDHLPPLGRYAHLIGPEPGEVRQVGYTEASRGCLHECLHCPITPVCRGRFFVVPRAVVLSDIEQQIAAGARHITFGDQDFFNGVGHSMAIARALHAAHPEITFDITVKVEHILEQKDRLAELARLGCIFLVSAIESLSARVLEDLEKGHTGGGRARCGPNRARSWVVGDAARGSRARSGAIGEAMDSGAGNGGDGDEVKREKCARDHVVP